VSIHACIETSSSIKTVATNCRFDLERAIPKTGKIKIPYYDKG